MKIAIITPSYNQGKFIKCTIESVLNQNYNNFVHIIQDNLSSDCTRKVLESYSDSRLVYVLEKDHGQADAVNRGIQKVDADIIGWLNSDDIYYNDTLQKIATYFYENPEIGIVYGHANIIDENGNILGRYPVKKYNFQDLKNECFICQPSVFFRKSIFNDFGPLNVNLNYCMDYEFWLKLSMQNVSFGFINKIISGTRHHSETKTNKYKVEVHLEILAMMKSVLGYIPERWLANYAHVLMRKYFNFFYNNYFLRRLFTTVIILLKR